jgi:hypothetical protein
MKITGDKLQGLGDMIPIRQVAVYASYKGEMPTKTPSLSGIPDGAGEAGVMRFDLNGNGLLDAEDYLLVYVTGSSDWAWDKDRKDYYYNLNRYEDYRHYWVTLKRTSGEGATVRMTPKVEDASAQTLTSFQNRLLFKKSEEVSHKGGDVEHGEKSGLDWRWELLTPSDSVFTYKIALPGIAAGDSAKVKLDAKKSSAQPDVRISFSDAPVCFPCELSLTRWYPFKYSGDSTLKLEGTELGKTEWVELASFEIKYEASLDFGTFDGKMTVFSPESGSTVRYRVSNLPGEPVYIFRIEADETTTLVDSLHPAKGSSCEWIDSAGKGIKYFLCAKSAFLSSPSPSSYQPQGTDQLLVSNLRGENQADFLVVSHTDFVDQALRLAKHKLTARRFSLPKVVTTEDIYREFSGGNIDPAGIRNFLLYAHTQWSVKPEYVVLMGKGHFNFKCIGTSEMNFIPVFDVEDRCIEDFYSYLQPGGDQESLPENPIPSIFVGRLPCTTKEQAQLLVDKIVDMEDPTVADFGAWRNRVLLVNDDDKQVDQDHTVPDPLGTDHRNASDYVGAIISSLRPSTDIRKVNLFEYPLNSVFQKPEARDALISYINSGTAFVNFFGHGSPLLWTDERILELTTVANLNNYKRYPLVASFSCAVGEFDQPSPHRCLSEQLMLASKSGAIATISSTREAYSENNRQLSAAFFREIDSVGANLTMGEAYARAKIIVRDQNSQIYSYLGDPSIRPVNLLHQIALDVLDDKGRPLDTLKGLQAITIKGSIRKQDNPGVDAAYGSKDKPAYIQINIFNPPLALDREGSGTDTIPGTLIYTGQSEVTGGLFEQSLHLPRNVIANKAGAKVTAFSWQTFDNAANCKPVIFDAVPDTMGLTDTVGPTIAIRPLFDDDASSAASSKNILPFSTGKIQGTLPFRCEINVFDSSGIDVAGTGPDEGLTYEITGVRGKENINNKFRIDGGDFRKGSATIELTEGMLKAGTYTLLTSAQDLAGNITRQSFDLEVSQSQDVAVTFVINYPNPVKMGATTAFYYGLSKLAGTQATIKVYSMSGKLLRVFHNARNGEVFDLRDQSGRPLGPNVYLYQLLVEDTYQQKTAKSGIQKLMVHPPR